jgi:hypothetical protein
MSAEKLINPVLAHTVLLHYNWKNVTDSRELRLANNIVLTWNTIISS